MPAPRLESVKDWPGLRHALAAVRYCEAWWFDKSRGVQTAGEVALEDLTVLGSRQNGHRYAPVRPVAARRLFRALPADLDHSNYTFIDFGSGKGRILLLAAEHPFREIQGVEFAAELHAVAEANLARYRHPRQRCRTIRSLPLDARAYEFPPGPLVVYFYNPFGAEVMQTVLANLDASLDADPRDVLLILLYPEQAHLLQVSRQFQPYLQTYHFHIYRSGKRQPTIPFCV